MATMHRIDQLRLVRMSLVRHPLRTALTLLGMVIGVASVVTMVSIGLGARAQIQLEIERLGTNLLTVQSIPRSQRESGKRRRLTEQDAAALRAEIFEVRYSVPVVNGRVRLVYGNHSWSTSLIGTHPAYVAARDWSASQGRNLSDPEVASAAKVALIGKTVAAKLSPLQPVLGSIIRVQDVPFRVIGILAEKGYSVIGRDQDDLIIVPISTAKKRLLAGSVQNDRNAVEYILVKARSARMLDAVRSAADRILRQRHSLREGMKDDFAVRDPMSALSAQRSASETMTILLGCVAAVSLLVGGISIMNIMLISVVERTREIGIRVAVGAQRSDIQQQFLIESAGVALVGGAIGCVLGALAAQFVETTAGWQIQLNFWVMLGALGFSALVGIASGVYPAFKASRLDPMEAIRQE
jgi:putative ABC transport system permease protein